jgi:hypothetical protein
MNEKTKTGLVILEAAVLMGILGDALLRVTPWGLNVFLWIGALAAAMIMLTLRRRSEFLNAQTISLHGALIFFAAMFVWRDSTELKVIDTLAILTILAILTLPALKVKINSAGIFHYFYAGMWSSISTVFSPFVLLLEDIKWKTVPQTGWTKHLIAVLRGLAIAAPILLVFGALFVAADAVFQGFIERTLNIDPSILLSHGFFVVLIAWLAAGYLRGTLFGIYSSEQIHDIKPQTLSITEEEKDVKDTVSKDTVSNEVKSETTAKEPEKKWDWRNFDNSVLPKALTLGAIETSIVLGLINLLFLSFVIVQIPYLFGGMELVQTTPDFKLAEYARRGFGELVIVAALVLPILLFSHWLLRKDNPINEKIYRILAGVQIILLFVIMISATQRLLLLTGNLGYGLTTIRLYPMWFMIWLAIIFVWFSLTVLRGTREQFAWGALWSAFFMIATLHLFNPDDFIVRTNVQLMNQGRQFDSSYAASLSDDAVPALIEAMPAMDMEKQCNVRWKLGHRFEQAQQENDFRTWNWSRSTARKEMTQNSEVFDTTGCPAETRQYISDF